MKPSKFRNAAAKALLITKTKIRLISALAKRSEVLKECQQIGGLREELLQIIRQHRDVFIVLRPASISIAPQGNSKSVASAWPTSMKCAVIRGSARDAVAKTISARNQTARPNCCLVFVFLLPPQRRSAHSTPLARQNLRDQSMAGNESVKNQERKPTMDWRPSWSCAKRRKRMLPRM